MNLFTTLFANLANTFSKLKEKVSQKKSTKIILKRLKKSQKVIKKWMRSNSVIMERFQLTMLYGQAFLSAIFLTKASTGMTPWIITTFFPGVLPIFEIPIMQFMLTPEKTYVLFFVLLNYMLNPKITPFSFFVRYNFFLVFSLEMIYTTTMMWSDLLLVDRTISKMGEFYTPTILLGFYNCLFTFLIVTYAYSYIQGILRKIPVFPGVLNGIPLSAAFWIRSRKTK